MIRFLIKAISNAIGFSKTEAKGTLVLILIVLGVFFVLEGLKWRQLQKKKDFEPSAQLKEWVAQAASSYTHKKPDEPKAEDQTKTTEPFTHKKSRTKTVEAQPELKRHAPPAVEKKAVKTITEKVLIDLNMATQEDLQIAYGIGPSYSARIIKYRALLGGFHDFHQLSEVYGLEDEAINELKKHFSIQSAVKKLPINTDSIKVLARHPYLTYDQAKVIIAYRKMHGNITSSQDLEKIKALDFNLINQLKPYLD